MSREIATSRPSSGSGAASAATSYYSSASAVASAATSVTAAASAAASAAGARQAPLPPCVQFVRPGPSASLGGAPSGAPGVAVAPACFCGLAARQQARKVPLARGSRLVRVKPG